MGYYYCIGLHCDATKYGGTPWSWAVSSGRALSATNTLRSFKRCGTKGVYRCPVRESQDNLLSSIDCVTNTNYRGTQEKK